MRLLIADDDRTSRQILQAVLMKWGFEVVSVRDGDEAWRALSQPDHPRLVILDWIMPGMDGLELVRRLRQMETTNPHYVIILTSRDEKRDMVEVLNAGADDYIAKPYDTEELLARIGVGRRVTELQAALTARMRELDEANAVIALLACTDELTGLANRRCFNEVFIRDISAARRHGHPLALIMADLDRFKSVNDSFGHAVGDRVLKAFAGLLATTTRVEDLSARWGGEEFLILLPHTTAVGAARLAERMRTVFAQTRCEGVDQSLSASFGVAELMEGEGGASLIQRADNALMRAKQAGRNRVVVASASNAVIGSEPPQKAKEQVIDPLLASPAQVDGATPTPKPRR
jgi:two-component system, cell cycle response regulator